MRNYKPRQLGTPTVDPNSKDHFLLERSLWREPRLWTPDQKPLGPVAIDNANPISRDMIACYLMQNDSCINTVDGRPCVRGTNTHPDTKTKSADCGTESDSWYFNHGLWRTALPGLIGKPFTIITQIQRPSWTSPSVREPIIDVSDDAYDNMFFIHWNGGTFANEVFADSNYHTINSGNVYSRHALLYPMVFCIKFDDYLYFYGPDGHIAQGTARSSWLTDSGANNLFIGQSGNNSTRRFEGLIHSIFIWNRALSHDEYMSMVRAPYQVLMPA